MSNTSSAFFIYFSSLILGIRHGIDWDHLAAITDIVSSSESKKEGSILGTLYASGHAAVIVVLGLLALLLGVILPNWIEPYMERFVGITLISLSIWVGISLIHHLRTGEQFRPKSRWLVIFSLFREIHHYIHSKLDKHYVKPKYKTSKYTFIGAFTIGMIHGIGAETPSQVILLATSAGAVGRLTGGFYLLSFVTGLFIANSIIVILSNFGYGKIAHYREIWLGVGILTALLSFSVGIFFLLGKATLLPVILGG